MLKTHERKVRQRLGLASMAGHNRGAAIFTKRITLRLPPDLHAALEAEAKHADITLNFLLVWILKRFVETKNREV